MKWLWTLTAAVVLAGTSLGQEATPTGGPLAPAPAVSGETLPPVLDNSGGSLFPCTACASNQNGLLNGTHKFDNFIGFMSNPTQNIDPRAVTEVWPIFGSTWFSTVPALPDGNMQLYGAGLYLALSDRLSVGMVQGGYATAHFNQGALGQFLDRHGLLENRPQFAGNRDGWLNLGGFAQYTVIEDAANQFLLTAGMRWEVPSGSQAIFQGNGPVHLAPYLTAGKEFGSYHVLATAGYQFPCGSSDRDTNVFYGNIHLDRKIGWLYPLVEVNWEYHTTSTGVDLPIQNGFIDFGNFESTGNIVTLAVGANAVLIPQKLEFGAVYTTPLAAQHGFDFNGLLVKMTYRY